MSVPHSQSPFRRASDVLADLHACRSWSQLEHFTLEQVHPLIGAARASWTEFRTEGRIGYNMWSQDHRELLTHYTPIINQFIWQDHPGITVLNPHEPWDRVFRITDFFSQREFECTGLCNEGYRPTESRYQLTLQVHCSTYSITTATFGRNQGDFTDTERETLDCLLPHFHLVANRLVHEQRMLEAYRHMRHAALDTLPCLSFDRDFFLRSANAEARQLLQQCPGFDGLRLPSCLCSVVADPVVRNQPIDTHLMIARSCFHLVGSVSTNRNFRFLSFEEETPDKYLQIRGQKVVLTCREREIAMWVRQGKSNREIAIILGISPRTVGKHLEHIFEKTHLENRASLMIQLPD